MISIAVLAMLIISMASLGIPVVNSLYNGPWGTFTVGITIPIAIFIGIYLKFIIPRKIVEATVIGISHILLCVILALAVWIIIVRPQINMPVITPYVHVGRPIIPGKVFPFLFITIAATVFPTSDYFSINTLPEVFAKLNMVPGQLGMLSQIVGENLAGIPGESVSLAVAMAYVFYKIPGLDHLMSYWYHFYIMFEALFILNTIDSGTRIGRYLLQDMAGEIYKPLGNRNS